MLQQENWQLTMMKDFYMSHLPVHLLLATKVKADYVNTISKQRKRSAVTKKGGPLWYLPRALKPSF